MIPADVKVEIVLSAVRTELEKAVKKHASMHSFHEGYAVILEELDELKEQVWKQTEARDLKEMRKEALQVAAMALRFVVDLL